MGLSFFGGLKPGGDCNRGAENRPANKNAPALGEGAGASLAHRVGGKVRGEGRSVSAGRRDLVTALSPGYNTLGQGWFPMMPDEFEQKTTLPRREAFDLPEGVIYLDGNSLGPLPRVARERIAEAVTAEWGEMLVRGWTEAGWIDLPARVGDRIAKLIGAAPGTVLAGDSTSVNRFQLLSAALALRPDRRVILSDTGNFPSDLYVAQGIAAQAGGELVTVAPEQVAERIDESVAVLMLTEVDYRTGRLHDMADLTARAHAVGALTPWELAHSAGARPVALTGGGGGFAVGVGSIQRSGREGPPAFRY